MKNFFFIIILLGTFQFSLVAQDEENKEACPEVENKKARGLLEKGTDKKKYEKPERLKFLQEALQLEPDYAEANWAFAQELIVRMKLDNKPFSPAVPLLLKAIQACPKVHSEPYYYIGFSYYEDGKNDSAIHYLKKFIAFTSDDEKKFSKDYNAEIYQAKEMIKYAQKESELKKKTVPFNPVVVGGISTKESEYLPYISPDGSLFLFTRTSPAQNIDRVYATDKEKETFIISKRKADLTFDAGKPMEYPFNQNSNEGGATLTIDNKRLYYTILKFEGGNQANSDIYFSELIEGYWTEIKKVPNINDPVFWDSQPSISADGNTLYFTSDRPGGYGSTDIWKSQRDPKTGVWGKPSNLGPRINTPGNEKCPFMHSDSETLYFSSDGHFGFGGMDIFYVRKDEKGEWKEPENIGSPINNEADDAGFFVSTDGKYGYFCSWDEGKVRGKGVGKYDVYSFDLYPEARPNEVAFIKGQLKEKDGTPVVANAVVELKNVKTNEKTLAVVDTSSGSFIAAVNMKKKDDLVITARAEDHAFASTVVSVKEAKLEKPVVAPDIEVSKTEVGKSFVINNIYYATGRAELYGDSYAVLDEFAEFLKDHPNMKVEIQGHTDNVGNESSNIALSNERAYTVKAYLEKKGIPGNHISAKGYGPSRPIADNSSPEGKSKNRRTEFLILEK